jgi:hypothetical protein
VNGWDQIGVPNTAGSEGRGPGRYGLDPRRQIDVRRRNVTPTLDLGPTVVVEPAVEPRARHTNGSDLVGQGQPSALHSIEIVHGGDTVRGDDQEIDEAEYW